MTVGDVERPPLGRAAGADASAPADALASATALAYARDWAAFHAWCRKRGCPALPAAPADVASYLTARVADRPRSRGTLDRQLAAIARAHRTADYPWAVAQHPAIRAVLRAAPRAQRAKRLTSAALGRLVAACGSDLAGLRDHAMLLLHLGAGLRRGDVVGLDAEHVRFGPAGLRLLLVPPDPEEGEQPPPPVECTVPPGTDPATCPVQALRAWLDASACRHGPVFRKVDRWGYVEHERFGVDEVRRILLRRATKAKLGLHKSQRLRPRGTEAVCAAEPDEP